MKNKSDRARAALEELFEGLAELAGELDEPKPEDLPDLLDIVTATLPRRITLKARAKIRWRDRKGMRKRKKALEARGFRVIGRYRIPQLKGCRLLAMMNEGQAAYAVVYEHRPVGQWIDLVRRFRNGSQVTYTNAPTTLPIDRPKDRKVRLPGADLSVLYDRLVEEPVGNPRPVSAKRFAKGFLKSWKDEMDWLARGGARG